MARYELVEGKSSKFWEIALSGATFTLAWGRIGTAGQTQTKDFDSAARAQAEHDSLVRQKTKKGYTLVAAGAAAPNPAPPAASPAAAPAKAKTPARSAATAPVAAPAAIAQSAPVVATESTAEADDSDIAVANTTTRASAGDGGVLWTDALRAQVHPLRGFPTPAPPTLSPAAAWARVREVWEKKKARRFRDAADIPLADAQRAAVARLDDPLAPLAAPLEVEAVTFHRLRTGRHAWLPDTSAVVPVVDFWVAVGGARFALDALLATLRLDVKHDDNKLATIVRRASDGPTTSADGPWFRLRAHLAAAPAEAWEQARAAAVEHHTKGNPLARFAVAYLFPDVDAFSAGPPPDLPIPVLMSLADPQRLAAGVAAQRAYDLFGGSGDGASLAATVLARHGAAATPTLVTLLEQAPGSESTRAVAALLAIVGAPAAVEALVSRLDEKELVAAAADAVRRFPVLAAPHLARLVAARGKASSAASALLDRLAQADDGPLVALAATLSEAARRALEAALAKASVRLDVAAPSELPPILASPPWTRPRRKVAAATRLELPPRDAPLELVWREGEEAEWRARHGQDYTPDDAVAYTVQNLGLKTIVGRLAHSLDPEREHPKAFTALVERSRRHHRGWAAPLGSAPAPFAHLLLRVMDPSELYGLEPALRNLTLRHGPAFFEPILSWAQLNPVAGISLLGPFRTPRAAPLAAHCLHALKKARDAGASWLLRHPEAAALGLLPVALGAPSKASDAATAALRYLAEQGHRDRLVAVAGGWSAAAVDALVALLDYDPLELFPSKLPKLPDFWAADAFTRPLLASGKALPVDAVEHLGVMLAFSRPDAAYAGIDHVKRACTAESLAAFAWDLFSAWQIAGWPSKEAWAFRALGSLGDDETARRIAPLIRAWPGEAAHARAVVGLDVLADIGSDVALMHLNGIAQKLKFKGLQEKAREKIALIADARELTVDELADRLVPDLGLDERGTLLLDFGSRRFTVAFDELLRPFVRDADGKRLKDLPKPGRADDAALAGDAVKAYAALKKDARTLGKQQLLRMELAMCARRRWPPSVFRTFLVEHPLLGHLVRRLVWCAYGAAGPVAAFRVAEDGSYGDASDDAYLLPAGVELGVAHALDLADEVAAAFGELFADYEILQPFLQLGRDVHRLTDAERGGKLVTRFEGITVPTGKVLGLEHQGWSRGSPQDAGVSWWYEKPVGGGLEAVLDVDPGIIAGSPLDMDPNQKLGQVRIHRAGAGGWGRADEARPLADVDPVHLSELLRDLHGLSA